MRVCGGPLAHCAGAPAGALATARRAPTLGKGHVFVWCDEWITFDSEWTQQPDYQVGRFWLNSLKWLSPINQLPSRTAAHPLITNTWNSVSRQSNQAELAYWSAALAQAPQGSLLCR